MRNENLLFTRWSISRFTVFASVLWFRFRPFFSFHKINFQSFIATNAFVFGQPMYPLLFIFHTLNEWESIFSGHKVENCLKAFDKFHVRCISVLFDWYGPKSKENPVEKVWNIETKSHNGTEKIVQHSHSHERLFCVAFSMHTAFETIVCKSVCVCVRV